MTGTPWYTECEVRDLRGCEWDAFCDYENDTKILGVLHLLTKHPEDYRRIIGKDPEVARKEYDEPIRALRAQL